MFSAISFLVAACFCGYLYFDAMAILSRTAASAAGRNAFGAAIEKIMHTMKRLLMFMYPPALGYLVMMEHREAMLSSIAYSFFAGSILLVIVILAREYFLKYFYIVTVMFQGRVSLFRSFANAVYEFRRTPVPTAAWAATHNFPLLLSSRWRLFLLASIVYFLYGNSIFFINLLAMRYLDFAPVLLQSLGIVNGVGTLLLAFAVDPAVSRYLDGSKGLGDTALVLLFSQLAASALFGPAFFVLVVLCGL